MTNINDIYTSDSDYLKAADMMGKEVSVTISGCTIDEIKNDKRLALSFKGKEKKLILNKTNAKKIAAAYSDDYSTWAGKDIFIYQDTTEYEGKTVPCLRVRIPVNGDFDDDIPF